jgi:steroid delta-isomerase-like uncharacterized protein
METDKSIVRRFFVEAWNSKDMTLVDELIAPTYIGHDVVLSHAERGPERIKRIMTAFCAAFPDLQVTVEDVVIQGEKEAVRWTARGTHQGTFMNIAPTGKQIVVSETDIGRVANGQIQEMWSAWDAVGLMRQLGAVS